MYIPCQDPLTIALADSLGAADSFTDMLSQSGSLHESRTAMFRPTMKREIRPISKMLQPLSPQAAHQSGTRLI
eukprot:4898156-Amphidinium_carterae.1